MKACHHVVIIMPSGLLNKILITMVIIMSIKVTIWRRPYGGGRLESEYEDLGETRLGVEHADSRLLFNLGDLKVKRLDLGHLKVQRFN